MSDLSEIQLKILRHALGLDYGEKVYRNYYCTGPGNPHHEECRNLESMGMMTSKRDVLNEMSESYIFNVTQKGLDAVCVKGEGL